MYRPLLERIAIWQRHLEGGITIEVYKPGTQRALLRLPNVMDFEGVGYASNAFKIAGIPVLLCCKSRASTQSNAGILG